MEGPRPIRLSDNAPDHRPIRQTVYLDSWVWIQLARAHYGKSQSGAWREAHDSVRLSAREGTARFPLSFAHVKEIAKRRNDASRGRLVDFMMEVWNADAIRPWPQMLDLETRNAVRLLMGTPPIDLTDFVFGKGLSHALGGDPHLVPKHSSARPPPPETIRGISELVMSPTLLATLKDSGLAARIGSRTESETRYFTDLQARINAAYRHPDKAKRRDIAKARFMITVVGDSLLRAMLEAAPDPLALMAEHLSSRGRIEAILESIPTFKTFHELTFASETTRLAKESDLWDRALNIAIPYCDVVATERSWCGIAESAGLDRLYGTKLVHRPSDLVSLLEGPT